MKFNIGIVGFQGDVAEHVALLRESAKKLKIELTVTDVRKKDQLKGLNGLVIPGGESTTIFKLLVLYDIYEDIRRMSQDGMPVMGTCAGLILISKETNDERVKGMGLINTIIERNAYGRQINSFQDDITITGIGKYRAVFIRAPVIADPGDAEVMSSFDGKPVMVRKRNVLGLTFHPELTKDTRIHEYFLRMVEGEGYISTGKK